MSKHQAKKETTALVDKHITAMFKECGELDYCMACVTEDAARSLVATYIANCGLNTMEALLFAQELAITALRAIANDDYELHLLDKDGTPPKKHQH